jgi:hypothetical protein
MELLLSLIYFNKIYNLNKYKSMCILHQERRNSGRESFARFLRDVLGFSTGRRCRYPTRQESRHACVPRCVRPTQRLRVDSFPFLQVKTPSPHRRSLCIEIPAIPAQKTKSRRVCDDLWLLYSLLSTLYSLLSPTASAWGYG